MYRPRFASPFRSAILLLSSLLAFGCGSSASSVPTGPVGGAVTGAVDSHCGSGTDMTVQSIGVCLTSDPPASVNGCGITFQPGTGDAGPPPDDGGATSEYGQTLYNATGYDDDCKYKISWTSTPIRVNTSVTFMVTATLLTGDMPPVHCADITVEAFSGNIPALSPATPAAEKGSTGTYVVGPLKFTQSGMWTVRFHLYEECSDAPADSPHGHAAFYVNVP